MEWPLKLSERQERQKQDPDQNRNRVGAVRKTDGKLKFSSPPRSS